MLTPTRTILGTQYYRPPNPPADATDLLIGERVCRQHGHWVVNLKARESRVFCLV